MTKQVVKSVLIHIFVLVFFITLFAEYELENRQLKRELYLIANFCSS